MEMFQLQESHILFVKKMNNKIINYCSGGLGNRLKPLSSCYALSQIFNLELFICWSSNYRCAAKFNELFKNNVNIIEKEQILDLKNCDVFCSAFDAKHVNILFAEDTLLKMIEKFGTKVNDNNKTPILNAFDLDIDTGNLLIFNNTFINGIEDNFNKKFIKNLIPTDMINEKIENLTKILGLNKEIIGVHARGSDFFNEYSVNFYDKFIDKHIVENKNSVFFVCSDDIEFEQYLYEKYRGKIILNTNKFYAQKNNISNNWEDNTHLSKQATIDGIVDLYLLSKTNFKIYHEKSTFSHLIKIIQENNANK